MNFPSPLRSLCNFLSWQINFSLQIFAFNFEILLVTKKFLRLSARS
uniref:Uncharacterized protein n=1 Tax=Parascaris univalens TaxID=6257 RepID=A0A915BFP0_PARUN